MGKAGKRVKKLFEDIQAALEKDALICPPCNGSEHLFCLAPIISDEGVECCCVAFNAGTPVEFGGLKERGGQIKSAEDITDVQSTGRKRCALMYPFEEGMICEWSNLRLAGGGVLPIVGCLDNKATNRHHGPDKNTLNNNSDNVHRICAFCHNYWHGQNDPYYGARPAGTEPFIPIGDVSWSLPDKTTRATVEEIILEQVRRKVSK